MRRHLTERELRLALERGREVAQLLGEGEIDGARTIRYVSMWRDDDGYVVAPAEVYDDGDEELVDVLEFTPVSGDDEDERWSRHPDADTALDAAMRLGAAGDRFVDHGVLGDEYLDLVRRRRSSE